MLKTLITCLVCLVVVFQVACVSHKIEPPDLNELYGEAAKKHHEHRNPVIVIPGILGSKLVDAESGRPVWGVFEGEYLDPEKASNAPVVALPMELGKDLADLTDSVYPDGALDRLKFRLLGMPIGPRAYAEILETLGAAGYRDEQLAASGAIDYGDDHFTCFQFSYDWRRSNVENAKQLDAFIREKKAFVRKKHRDKYGEDRGEIKFDIVAHSMGGLIARYYLRYGTQRLPKEGGQPVLNWAGAKEVNQLIMVGTPNSGSVLAFEELERGKEFVPKWARALTGVSIPNYPAAVMGTYPSIYELMPRVRHRAFVDNQRDDMVNVYDVELWERYSWGMFGDSQMKHLKALLPTSSDNTERRAIARDHVAKCLKNAAQFQRALDRKATPPSGLKISIIAGDSEPTKERFQMDLNDGSYIATKYGQGDGVVLRTSALADERAGGEYQPQLGTPISFDQVMFLFNDHLNMTKDPIFSDNVLFKLLEE